MSGLRRKMMMAAWSGVPTPLGHGGHIFKVNTISPNFTIQTGSGAGSYNYDVYVDGVLAATGRTGNYTVNVGSAGVHEIEIIGTFPYIYWRNATDRTRIIEIKQWGNIVLYSLEHAFWGCSNLAVISAVDTPNIVNVTNMNRMFGDCVSLVNISMKNWETGNNTNFARFFDNCSSLKTLDGTNLDLTSADRMQYMFSKCGNLENVIGIENWDVSNIELFQNSFTNAKKFNQDLSGWCVGNASNYSSFDSGATLWASANKPNFANPPC